MFTEQFLTLIREKQNEVVKLILEDCHYNHTVITQKATLLHYAAKHGNAKMTEYLLNKGCNVDAQDSDGNTPLMLAAAKSGGKIIQLLLAAGAGIDIQNNSNEDALRLALNRDVIIPILIPIFQALRKKHSRQEIIDKLMDYHCALDQAVCSKDVKIVEHMLNQGHPVNLPNKFPLHVAVVLSHVQMVKVLLECGADIETRSPNGATPIYYLHSWLPGDARDKLQILKLLLSKGVSLTSFTSIGCFQIGTTLARGTFEIIREILQSNPDFNAREHYSEGTMLHILMLNKNPGVVDELKHYIGMFDINARDKYGHGPLSWAASKGNTNMVKLLLDAGAKIDTPSLLSPYLTQIEPHLENLRDQCAQYLLERCADPQVIFTAINAERNAILDMALENKRFDRINFALARLAICEKQGVVVNERTCSKINSHQSLKTYFEKCRRLLRKNISESVSVFQLLDADDKKMVKHLYNEKLVSKLMRLNRNSKLKCDYWYYYSILKKRVSKGFVTKALRDKAAEFICEISGDRLDPRNLATEMVLDYLNDQDLRKLYAFLD